MNVIALQTLITVAASALTGAATWFVSRRKRKNDFISELQNSIDLLAGRYNSAIEQIVALKEQNVKLNAKLNILISENEELRRQLYDFTTTFHAVRLSEPAKADNLNP